MADSARTAEPTRKAQDTATRAGNAAMGAATEMSKDAMSGIEKVSRDTAGNVREMQQAGASRITETAEAATQMSATVADQGRDVMLTGARTAAGVGGQMADIGYSRGHQMLTSTVQVMDIYRDAAERSAGRLQSLFTTYMTLGRGIQQMQHAWLEMLDRSIENATHKPQDLLRCKNVVELAEVQRDLYLETVHHAFDSTSRLLGMAGQTVQEAARPMETKEH